MPYGPPLNITWLADNSTGHVSVQWMEPALWLQNGIVIGYMVQYQRLTVDDEQLGCSMPQSSFLSQKTDEPSVTLTGLRRSSWYAIRVAAATGAGVGIFSACTTIRTPSADQASSSSSGTAIGIAIGVIFGLILVILAMVVIYKRHLRRKVDFVGAKILLEKVDDYTPAWMTGEQICQAFHF